MKKLLLICFIVFLSSCKDGVYVNIEIKEGDTRITETSEYRIIEVCDGCNGFGNPLLEVY